MTVPPDDQEASPPRPRPQGRPKRVENTKTIVHRVAQERHTVSEGGHRRSLTTVELLLRVLRAKAMAGDLAANKLLDEFAKRHQPTVKRAGYLVVPEACDSVEEWTERFGKKGVGVASLT